jgi:ectoine hydroxylase-related dioxygenase (phytanoyl-CoA dioxygenase family)
VPGSHCAERSPPPFGEPVETVAAEMPAGSVMVFDGSIWHGGGANRTDEFRLGIAMNYCAGWLRQQENQQLGIPADIAREFSPRLHKLVGYGLYKACSATSTSRPPSTCSTAARPPRSSGS